tara:strand:- start:80 stop:409 length:330 start_codon:yes stop_codon:yes gene_type:complete
MKYRAYIDESLARNLQDIVDMHWEEERKHWDELECPDKHIYHSLNNLRNFLIKLKNETPADIDEWEVISDEELWEDGEISESEVKRKIINRVLNTGDWRLQSIKENHAK